MLLLYLCAVFLIQLDLGLSKLTPTEQSCVNDLNLNQAVIEYWNTKLIVPEENPQFNKFMECYWKRRGYQNQNGEINFGTVQNLIHRLLGQKYNDQTKAQQATFYVMDTCRDLEAIGNHHHGKIAAKFSNCVVKAIQKN